MPGQPLNSTGKTYLRIVNGSWAQTVDKGTEGAKLREYEGKNGQKGSKWELYFSSWTGRIHTIEFRENEFGIQCLIDVGDAVLTLPTDSRYFADLASKLPSANLAKDLTFHPFNMDTETGKKVGISLQQDGVKLKNFYWDGTKKLHGYPEVDETKKSKNGYWKFYFAEVSEFLISELHKLKITKTVGDASEKEIQELMSDELMDPKTDLPF